ncbi:MAG: hypothetical protein EBS05_22410 [Proteobacteria bacterium]|nr:hypothetical protein [Pseudomonadota bacterium]
MKTHNRQRAANYFQFPLCALAFATTTYDRVNTILDYAVVETGRVLWQRNSAGQRLKQLNVWKCRTDLPRDIKLDLPAHHEALAGAETIGVIYTHIGAALQNHTTLAHFVSTHEARHGRSPLVRIRRDLFFEARDGKGLTYAELTVLAGLYSVIGRKQKPVLVTQATIRHRALGYKSPVVQRAELPRRTDGAKPLTEWQLRHTLERLHERGLFARFTFGRRLTYYSHRMKDKALRAAVVERKTRSSLFQMGRKFDDQDATDQIRNLRALAAGKPPARPGLRGNFIEGEPFSGDAPPPLH